MDLDCPHCDWSGERRFCPACGAALWSPDTDEGAAECTVVLSFDVDGSSGMINRDPRVEQRPSARSFGDYGPTVAVPHILTALARADAPASFYIPGWVAERWPATVEQIAAAGHEIGHHGYLHEPPATLSPEEEAEVLDRGSDILQDITGEPVVGYRSPSWGAERHLTQAHGRARIPLRLVADGIGRSLLGSQLATPPWSNCRFTGRSTTTRISCSHPPTAAACRPRPSRWNPPGETHSTRSTVEAACSP